MNKKLLSGLMSVVMLAGSCPTLGAHEVGKSKVSNNSVVRFVKNHKKIIAGILVVGAGAGVGYYKREEVKNGFDAAKDKIENMTLGLLKKELNAVKINSRIESKPVGRIEAEEKEKVESVKSVTGSETSSEPASEEGATKISENVEQSIIETRVNEEESESEPESGEDATGSTTVPTTETESVKSATESKTGVATKTSQDKIGATIETSSTGPVEQQDNKVETKTEAKTESEVEEKEEVKKQYTAESLKSISSPNVGSKKPKTNSTYVLGGDGGKVWILYFKQ